MTNWLWSIHSFFLKPEHRLYQGRCNSPALELRQYGKRVKVILAGAGLIVHFVIVISHIHTYHWERDIPHLAVSGPIVCDHQAGGNAVA